jgi:hypothetical protein
VAEQDSLEISVTHDAGYADAGEVVGERAKDAFNALGDLLSDAIEPFKKKLAESAASADEIELKLELALKGAGKWVVVSVEGGATVSVKLLWKRKQ